MLNSVKNEKKKLFNKNGSEKREEKWWRFIID